MIEIKGKYTTAKIMINDVEEECLGQVSKMINHEAFTNPVCIMPDTHAGKGSVIGFTMPMSQKVIPNVIGVDIGCGVLMANIGKELKHSLAQIDKAIHAEIPMGFRILKRPETVEFDYEQLNTISQKFTNEVNCRFHKKYIRPVYSPDWIKHRLEVTTISEERFFNSIGTLGGGNHFIEIGKGDSGFYITIHSGSRNFGARVAEFWQKKAISRSSLLSEVEYKNEIIKIKKAVRHRKQIEKEIKKLNKDVFQKVDRELAWLEGEQMMEYLYDMIFAQYYANLNRRQMMKKILKVMDVVPCFEMLESIHNYIDFRDLVIRKGAISSYDGEKMIIPFNMRDGILICEGISNPEWNFSAPHGAGRIMSRSQAKKSLSMESFQKSMRGIYSSTICTGTLDESPFAYKDSILIEKAIEPTAKVLEKIKPILNVKSKDGG